MGKITEFWQTENDFKDFLKLIDESGAELLSYRGDRFSFNEQLPCYDGKYLDYEFSQIYLSNFHISRIVLKGAKIPMEYSPDKKYHWLSHEGEFIEYMIPKVDKKNNIILNGGIVLSKHLYSNQYLAALYNQLSKHIKKNYTKAKNAPFSIYAGPDFLAEWKKGNLSGGNGPIRESGEYVFKAEFNA